MTMLTETQPLTKPERIEAAGKMMLKGKNNREIAEALGVKSSTISNDLRAYREAHGMSLPERRQLSNDEKNEAMQLKDDGMAVAAIARQMDVPERLVKGLCRRAKWASLGSIPRPTVTRTCIVWDCDREFRSEHAGHRMCNDCRGSKSNAGDDVYQVAI